MPTKNKIGMRRNSFSITRRRATHPPPPLWSITRTVAQSEKISANERFILFCLCRTCFSCQADLGGKIKTSDSDFSDSEAGRTAKVGHVHGRIRQAALYLFYDVVKV